MVFRSIVARLAKPNEKFMYGSVREGGRARDFEEAIEWLVSAGMLNRVYNVSRWSTHYPHLTSWISSSSSSFDTGLLKHMAGIDNSAILLKADYQFKGPLTENYVLQQLQGQFEVPPDITPIKPVRSILSCNTGRRSFPWKPKAARISLPLRSNDILQTTIRNTHCAFPNVATARMGEITNLPLYLAGKTKRSAVSAAMQCYTKEVSSCTSQYGFCI